MIHVALFLLLQSTQATAAAQSAQAAKPQIPAPTRGWPDPGVIATGRRVAPVGLQSVFDGRVYGVRFGRTADEVWVAGTGSTFRLDWRANKVLARAITDGHAGVYGLAIDPVTHRALLSSVGRLPRRTPPTEETK